MGFRWLPEFSLLAGNRVIILVRRPLMVILWTKLWIRDSTANVVAQKVEKPGGASNSESPSELLF